MLPYPPLLWPAADLRGGPASATQTKHTVMTMKLSCPGYTPCLHDSPPFLSRSFLERVGAELSSPLFFAFPFESDASDLVGFLFISDPTKSYTLVVEHNTEDLTRQFIKLHQ